MIRNEKSNKPVTSRDAALAALEAAWAYYTPLPAPQQPEGGYFAYIDAA